MDGPRGGSVHIVAVRTEVVLPVAMDKLWKLLWMHLDESKVREIHPWILSGQVAEEGEEVQFGGLAFKATRVVDREVKLAGGRSKSTWKYRIRPPDTYNYDIVFENGSTVAVENTYSEAPGGTLVRTTGEASIKGLPKFLQGWFVKRVLTRADREDFEYVRKLQM